FPATGPGSGPATIRLFPAPGGPLLHVAVDTATSADGPVWEVLDVTATELELAFDATGATVPGGLLVEVATTPHCGGRAARTGNLLSVRHGVTTNSLLGSGDALDPHLELTVRDAPVTSDLDASGNLVPTLVVRVDGLAWNEVPTLYGTGPDTEYVT